MSKALQVIDLSVPGVNLQSYINSVASVAVLSAEQERSLAEKYFYHKDVEAARQLVLAHLRFVVHIAKSYMGYGLPQADIIQEGNVGLMKAVKRFDPSVGVRLVSFAVYWIKAEIHEYVLRNWRIVKVATTKAQRKLFFNLRKSKKGLDRLNSQEAKHIADDLSVSVKDVTEMEGRLLSRDASFDGPVAEDSQEKSFVPAQYLEDATGDPAIQYEQERGSKNDLEHLDKAIAQLDERSRDILRKRWLSDKKMTLHDLAAKYKVSAERIRQLEQNAFKKIKSMVDDVNILNA